MRRIAYLPLLGLAGLFLIGCPKADQDYSAGRKAESLSDYDTALVDYDRALRADPDNAEYKLRATHLRFEAGQFHLEQGEKALQAGNLQLSLAEFQKAQAIDPSNAAADQQVKHTMDLLQAKADAETSKTINPNPVDDDELDALGEQPRFRVRETLDWKQHAADLESEMLKRGMIFEVIDWDDKQAKLPLEG